MSWAMGPAFKLPLRALTAILASDGRAGVVDYAQESDDDAVKFVALLLINVREAVDVMKALVDLSAEPENPSLVRRLKKRLKKALAATKALVDAESRLAQSPRPTGERNSADHISHGAHEAEPLS